MVPRANLANPSSFTGIWRELTALRRPAESSLQGSHEMAMSVAPGCA